MRVAVRPFLTGASLALGLTLGLVAPLALPSVVQAQEVTPSVPPPGALDVDVALLGDRASAGPLSVRVACTQIAQFGTATYDRTEAVPTTGVSATVSFATIPPGSDCNVTLPADGSGTGVTAAQDGIVTVTPLRIGPNERASLGGTITYTAARAGLAVTVKSTGGAATDPTRTDVTATVNCGAGTTPVTLTFPGGAAAPTSQTQVVSGIRPGTSCTVTQTAAGTPTGKEVVTTGSPATVVVPAGGAATTITNAYENPLRTVSATWTVAGAAAGTQGAATARLVCADGQSQEYTIPAGTTTTVPLALTPTLQVREGTTCGMFATASGSIVVDGDPDDTLVDASLVLPASAAVPAGALTLATTATYTAITPAPAPVGAPVPVTLAVDLTAPVGLQRTAAFRLTCGNQVTGIVLAAGATEDASVVLADVPLAEECAASTVLDGARPGVTPSVTLPALPLVVGPEPPNTVTVGYTTAVATATIDPRVVIAGAAAAARGAAELTVNCGAAQTRPIAAAAASPVDLADVTGVVGGTACTLTSTANGQTATAIADTSWSPVTVTPGPGETARVTVTNTYTAPAGNIAVFHQIRGNATPYRGAVTITVVCNDAPPTSATLTSSVGSPRVPVVLSNLAVGTDCTITQTAAGGVDGLTVSTAPPAAQVVEAAAGVTRVGRVTNTYTAQLGTVTVTKSITGSGASLRGDVTVRVACTSRTGTFTLPAGASTPSVVTVDSLYPGETCTVSETANGAVEDVVEVDTVISPSPTVNIALGTRAAVTVTNEYTAVGAAATTTTTPGATTVAPTTTVAGGGGAGGGSGLPAAGSNVARVVWFAVAAISLGLAVQITRHRLLPHKR